MTDTAALPPVPVTGSPVPPQTYTPVADAVDTESAGAVANLIDCLPDAPDGRLPTIGFDGVQRTVRMREIREELRVLDDLLESPDLRPSKALRREIEREIRRLHTEYASLMTQGMQRRPPWSFTTVPYLTSASEDPVRAQWV